MSRRLAVITLLATAVSLYAVSASATEVYKWTDGNGQVRYSQNPPAKGKFTKVDTRTGTGTASESSGDASKAADGKTATAKTTGADSQQCKDARSNISMLEGKGPVQIDSDGDGKPDKNVDDAERTKQLELARAVVNANC